jgi:hypothetical protein
MCIREYGQRENGPERICQAGKRSHSSLMRVYKFFKTLEKTKFVQQHHLRFKLINSTCKNYEILSSDVVFRAYFLIWNRLFQHNNVLRLKEYFQKSWCANFYTK